MTDRSQNNVPSKRTFGSFGPLSALGAESQSVAPRSLANVGSYSKSHRFGLLFILGHEPT